MFGCIAARFDFNRLVFVNLNGDDLIRGLRGLTHTGHVNHAGGDEGRCDHKNNQEHEHHIDEGNHIDFINGSASFTGALGNGWHGVSTLVFT